ncbi:MAG: UDP-N-acetylmuramoyl-tripeptide--D-alanyl-D-alanine ligase, partial [Bacteroidetes bacterium]|nr:UDP-N-acetylmuramoyl-tripeptide--D-alanyl-D-alanine ligase [Bacteroidota bacterium]
MNSAITRLYQIYLDNPQVTTDSRVVKQGSVFFALKGENFDGNKYALDAVGKGARLAVVDNITGTIDKKFMLVKNVLEALQELAGFHRRNLGLKIIALTGTNGKTTTKELITRVLAKKYKVGSTKGNLNNHIGVPLTLLTFGKDLDFGIVEMGANHIGEIAALCKIARPDFGLITNIGKAHLEGFGGIEGVLKAKTELYKHLRKQNGVAFVNSQNELLAKASEGIKRIRYGADRQAESCGKIISNLPFLTIGFKTGHKTISIESKLIGKYNFENIMAAVAP